MVPTGELDVEVLPVVSCSSHQSSLKGEVRPVYLQLDTFLPHPPPPLNALPNGIPSPRCRLEKVVLQTAVSIGGGGGAAAARSASGKSGSNSFAAPMGWASLEESGGETRVSSMGRIQRAPPPRRTWVDGNDSALQFASLVHWTMI